MKCASFPVTASFRAQPGRHGRARVEVDSRKRDPMDFALWKAANRENLLGQPLAPAYRAGTSNARSCPSSTWDLVSISRRRVRPVFPPRVKSPRARCHHSFVRYWMHNGFINANEEKCQVPGQLLSGAGYPFRFSPEVVRFFLCPPHRAPWTSMMKAGCCRRGLEGSGPASGSKEALARAERGR